MTMAILLAAALGVAAPSDETKTPVSAENARPACRLRGSATVEVDSSYITYGRVYTSHPISKQYARLKLESRDFGWAGFYYWQAEDLDNHRRDKIANAIWGHEFALMAGYAWKLSDSFSLDQEVHHFWYTFPHWKGGKHTTRKFHYLVQLTNPYVTPFFHWVRQYETYDGSYFELGLKHDFKLTEALGLQILGRTDLESTQYMEHSFKRTDAGGYRGGPVSVQLLARPTYRLTDNLFLFGEVGFLSTVNDELRDSIKRDHSADARDLVWWKLGLTAKF